jgi:hypothetical protein
VVGYAEPTATSQTRWSHVQTPGFRPLPKEPGRPDEESR